MARLVIGISYSSLYNKLKFSLNAPDPRSDTYSLKGGDMQEPEDVIKKSGGTMKRFLHVGLSLAITGLVSCNSNGKSDQKSDDSTSVSASGSVSSKGFALSLPDLPGTPWAPGLAARVQIFSGELKREEACSPSTPVPDPAPAPTSSGGGTPAPSVGLAGGQSNEASNNQYQPLVDASVEYRAGTVVGPFSLQQGVFTVFFDVNDGARTVLMGASFFEVASGRESVVDLKLKRMKPCGPAPGSVIIKVSEETPDSSGQVSACKYLSNHELGCKDGESATCKWGVMASKECGVEVAKQSLIGLLCRQGTKVPEATFLNEILCESTVNPNPQPTEPQPTEKENLPPVAINSRFQTTLKQVTKFKLNAKDPEGDPLRYEIIQKPKFGNIDNFDINAAVVVYRPISITRDGDVDRIVFIVKDGRGAQSQPASLFIKVLP